MAIDALVHASFLLMPFKLIRHLRIVMWRLNDLSRGSFHLNMLWIALILRLLICMLVV